MVRDFEKIIRVIVDLNQLAIVRSIKNAVGPAGHAFELVILEPILFCVLQSKFESWRKTDVSLTESEADALYPLFDKQLIVHCQDVPLVGGDKFSDDVWFTALDAVVHIAHPNHCIPVLHLVRIDIRVRAVDDLVRVPFLAVLRTPAPLRQILHVFTFELFLRCAAAKETLLGLLLSF